MHTPSNPIIGLVDYGAGNLLSVHNALCALGTEPRLVRRPGDLSGIDKLILPGVGSFGDCVENLTNQGLWEPLRQWLADGRPYFGICLGYQILFSGSEESPGVSGFGHFAGSVRRFAARPGLKVPHMGWNIVEAAKPAGLWQGLPDNPYFYFVHSFHPVPEDTSVVAGWTSYDGPFAAAVESGAVQAVQFHPERSQDNGLQVLRNFALPPSA